MPLPMVVAHYANANTLFKISIKRNFIQKHKTANEQIQQSYNSPMIITNGYIESRLFFLFFIFNIVQLFISN